MNYASDDCKTTIVNSIFVSNGATFSGCIDMEVKRGWLITRNNSYLENYNMYEVGAGSVYSIRGGNGLVEGNRYIGNIGKIKGKTVHHFAL